MNIKSQKGFALGFAIFFVVLAAISSVAMYSAAFYLSNEVTVKDQNSVRGHYISMAGLRYGKILLKNGTGFNFNTAAMDGETKTVTITSATPGIGSDLGLTGNDNLAITARECNSDGSNPDKDLTWLANTYKVSASFTS